MRKLVLSGFLASEEIYINQLEALLLVSTCSGAFWSRHQTLYCFHTAFGIGGAQGPGPIPPCRQSLLDCSAYSLALGHEGHCQEGPVPLCTDPPVPALGKAGEVHQIEDSKRSHYS